MKVTYVIYNEWSKEQREALSLAGISVESGFSRIEVEENEKNRSILGLIDQWGIRKSVGTLYDKNDFDESELFAFIGVWEYGYPQPEDDFGYMDVTYNLMNYRKECGIGALQKAPFQIKKQLQWGKKFLFELNWVMDEIFVSREAYEHLFKKYGVDRRPVLLYKKNIELADTFQLDIPFIDVPLDLKDQPSEECKVCGRKRYTPQVKGYYPGFTKAVPPLAIFKSREYFGSGGQAFNRIFISKELFEEIKKKGIKINVAPVDPACRIGNWLH